MVDFGDLGGLVGAIAGAYAAVKWIGKPILYQTLGPAYVAASTLLGLYLGHQAGHYLSGSGVHAPAQH